MSCEHDKLRLPCPTCGGDGELAEPLGDCPDCTDGRMSHEQAWKIVAAVFDDEAEYVLDVFDSKYLRGIR